MNLSAQKFVSSRKSTSRASTRERMGLITFTACKDMLSKWRQKWSGDFVWKRCVCWSTYIHAKAPSKIRGWRLYLDSIVQFQWTWLQCLYFGCQNHNDLANEVERCRPDLPMYYHHRRPSTKSNNKGTCLTCFASGTGLAGVFGFFWKWLWNDWLGMVLVDDLVDGMGFSHCKILACDLPFPCGSCGSCRFCKVSM